MLVLRSSLFYVLFFLSTEFDVFFFHFVYNCRSVIV